MSKNVIYVGAHPDDILSVAGTLCLLKDKGYNIYEFCMSRGEKLTGANFDEVAALRTLEEENVCKIIGAELKFFEQGDGEIYADKAICEAVAAEMAKLQPVAVFTLWALEKPDHAATAMIASKAMNLAGLTYATEFYMSKVDYPLNYCYKPDMYVDISGVIDRVEDVVKCYKHELHGDDPYLAETVQRKRALGESIFVDAAESFVYTLEPINRRWGRKSEVGEILRGI